VEIVFRDVVFFQKGSFPKRLPDHKEGVLYHKIGYIVKPFNPLVPIVFFDHFVHAEFPGGLNGRTPLAFGTNKLIGDAGLEPISKEQILGLFVILISGPPVHDDQKNMYKRKKEKASPKSNPKGYARRQGIFKHYPVNPGFKEKKQK
jgi:hypothetical protein